MATLNIRDIDDTAAARIKQSAHVRGLTMGQYLARLAQLHDVARARADAGDDALTAELTALGLATVTA